MPGDPGAPSTKATLARDGWHPDIFGALIGASGGAKLLGIAHLDRYLVRDFLPKGSKPISLYGSSIGSWRHAAKDLRGLVPAEAIPAGPDAWEGVREALASEILATRKRTLPEKTRQICWNQPRWHYRGHVGETSGKRRGNVGKYDFLT